MQNLAPRHVKTEESVRLGVVSGWYSTKVSGTFVSGPHDSEADCLRKIAEIDPPPAKALKASPLCSDPVGKPMALTRGSFGSYEFDRMVVLFSMIDGEREIPCAVSTSAMDDLERAERTKPDQREAQFIRLRDQIEARAAYKFLAKEFEGTPPGIILRSLDFRTGNQDPPS